MPSDDIVQLYRFANRAPLTYQQSACAITQSVIGTAWKSYGVNQSRGALPTGPMVILVQIASVWVPFTSESKEAVAHYPEIIKEIKLALQEARQSDMVLILGKGHETTQTIHGRAIPFDDRSVVRELAGHARHVQ